MRAFLNRLRIFELLEDRCVRASLSGSVFTDDSTTLPRGTIQGALVWIDQNSNQILDDGDLKSWTDASGEYHFQNLPIGNYEVRLRPPAGTFQTSPQQFFALQYDSSSQTYRLVTLDPTSQSIIPASVSGFPDNRAGLIKTVDGEYFGAGHLLDTIVKFDIETGEETIYPKSPLQFVAGLAYDPTMDEIYTLARESEDEPLRLFRINRIDAAVTPVSESIPDIPVAMGTSALAFDWVNRQVISFDNASDTFYKHDLRGNAERLGTFEIPTAFYNLSFDGTRFLTFYDRGGDTIVAEVDPYTATATVVYSLSGSLSVNAGDITANGTPQHVIIANNNTPGHADFVVGRLDLPTAKLEMAGNSLRLTSPPKSIDLMVPLDNPGGTNQVCIGLGPSLLDLDTTSLNLAGGLLVQLTDNNDSVSLGDTPDGLLVDAGGGIDQAYITAPSSLDLSQPAAHLTGFEKVIFLGPSGSELTIDPHSIQQISGDQSLKVELRADQSIRLADAMWRSETPKIEGGQRVHQIATDNSLLELTDQFGWHNPLQGLDVNFDGLITPLDALRVVNFLNANGTAVLSVEIAEHASAAYIDTSRDNRVTALDLLLVINHLNGQL